MIILKRLLYLLVCTVMILVTFVTFVPIFVIAAAYALIVWVITGNDVFDESTNHVFWMEPIMSKLKDCLKI